MLLLNFSTGCGKGRLTQPSPSGGTKGLGACGLTQPPPSGGTKGLGRDWLGRLVDDGLVGVHLVVEVPRVG